MSTKRRYWGTPAILIVLGPIACSDATSEPKPTPDAGTNVEPTPDASTEPNEPTPDASTPSPDGGDDTPLSGPEGELLASGQQNPLSLAIDGDDVYWINSAANGVMRLPKAGGTPQELVSDRNGTAIAVRDDTVYFVSATALYTVPKTGGTASLLSDPPELKGIFNQIVVTKDNVIWASGTDIRSVPRAGGKFAIVPLPCNGCGAAGIAADDTHAYWVGVGANKGNVVRWTIGTMTLEPVANMGGMSLTANDTHVFVGGGGGGVGPTIQRAPKGTKTAEEVVVPESNNRVAYLTFDATHLYWTDGNSPSLVKRVLLDGGEVQVVAASKGFIPRIAVDDTHVYWTDAMNGEIRRIAKAP